MTGFPAVVRPNTVHSMLLTAVKKRGRKEKGGPVEGRTKMSTWEKPMTMREADGSVSAPMSTLKHELVSLFPICHK